MSSREKLALVQFFDGGREIEGKVGGIDKDSDEKEIYKLEAEIGEADDGYTLSGHFEEEGINKLLELHGFKTDAFGNISTISEAEFKIQTDSYRYEITDGSVTHDEKTPAASTFKFRCAIRDDNWKGGCFEFEGTCYSKLGRYEGTWSTTTDQKKGEFVL